MPSTEHTAMRQAAALERIASALEKIAGMSTVGRNPLFPHPTGPFRVTSTSETPQSVPDR